MRIRSGIAACALVAGLAACAQEEPNGLENADMQQAETIESADVALESAPQSRSADVEAADPATIPDLELPATLPKIAYSYQYGFSLPGDGIVKLQQRHADMCEAKGPSACRILGMTGASAENEGQGTLQLAVRSEIARGFGSELGLAAQDAGGEQTSTGITGEDLSKQIVDTEARLEARTALRDRLMDELRNRRGSVSDLVQAEREVAKVTEEIEAAQAWIGEMRGRVSFSRMTLDYASSTPMAGSFARPIGDAFGNIGGIAGTVIACLLMLGAVVLPIGLAVLAGRRIAQWAKTRGLAGSPAGEA